MKNRTAIVILLVAAGLLAFILLFERDRMTTSELEGRKGRVFVEYRRDAVTELTLRGGGGRSLTLVRRGDPEDPAEERWYITGAGRELLADSAAVRQVLSAIDFLLEDRVVREPGALADPSFGLAEPRVEVSFTARGLTTSFKVGANAPGDKVYLAVAGRAAVIAVEGGFLEEVDKGLDDLRDRRLVERPLSGATAVAVRGGEAPFELSRPSDRAPWRVGADGEEILAAAERVGGLLRELGRLQGVRFVTDEAAPESLGGYGLDPPLITVEVESAGAEKVEIRLGGGCEGADRLIHATLTGSGTVACVDPRILDELAGGAERFRELRLAPVREDDVIRVTLASKSTTLTLFRDEDAGTWNVAGDDDGVRIDAEAIGGLLGLVTTARATTLIPGHEAVAGLAEPLARVVLDLAGEQPPVELEFHPRAEPERIAVRRKAEPALLVADAALLDAVKPDLLAFRLRVVENGAEEDLTGIEIAGPIGFALKKKDGAWSLASPVELAADGGAARRLAGRVSRIEVARFESAAARPGHGLDRPHASIGATFIDERPAAKEDGARDRTGERRVVIEIGAETDATDGSRFGRVAGGDGAVFVLSRSWLEDLQQPPVARDLLQVDAEPIRRAFAVHPGGTIEIARDGASWRSAAAGFEADAFGRAFADLAAVRTLRAVSLGQRAAVAVGEPRLTLELFPDGEDADPDRLIIGGPSDDPDEKGVLLRREGLDATFAVPARILDDLLAALGLGALAD